MHEFDLNNIRSNFSILEEKIYNKPLVYFDNAATTQKPHIVINTLDKFYTVKNSNIHRGIYYLSQQATDAYEKAREIIKNFMNAKHEHEIIFTRGTTESINLVASTFSKAFLNEGDNIIISAMEHHSNLVPWQMACNEKKAKLKVLPFDENGEIDLELLSKLIDFNTKLIAITHVSNTLGTVNPVKKIIEIAHKYNIPVLIDGAQAIAHTKVDVTELDCDFYCFSGHKLYGPTGIGVLYGKEEWLNKLPPYQYGGEMIDRVTFEHTTFNVLPFKFEAGTAHISGALGLASAVNFVQSIGFENIEKHETELLNYATKKSQEIEGMRIYGNAQHKASLITFTIEGLHHFDIGTLLDKFGIAVRTGHFCTQPIMDIFQVSGMVRASFAMYNTKEEIDFFFESLNKVIKMLR
ncbi:MAG: cysteine sulfinate desulfinase [Bacteroidetes bacterium GWE2_29_8]|nr:MAG: cysteine sulfinate desulfinase [Bacteroidetes bacterium GWE2_29_8]OFY15995.1 MAG: cysteine sulfinate desulfinase [Bacteroidetes bacterium GWF2_29_10]